MLDAAAAIRDRLTAAGLRVKMDDSDQSPGWKFAQYEMKGVPVRVEIGPRDMEKEQCCIARRDTGEKTFVPVSYTHLLMPNMDFPYVILITSDPGASPEAVSYTHLSPRRVRHTV